MKRKVIMVLLALGVVGGYGSGLVHAMHHHHAACGGWHHEQGSEPGHEHE